MKNRLLAILLFAATCAWGQQVFRPKTLDIRDGLSQNYVICLAQDREGFLWAGTKNGLNRFDGRQFKVWTNDADNPNSLANDWVWSIEPHEDFLLIGTNGGGLDFFDRRSARFFHLPRQNGMSGIVTRILFEQTNGDGNIWLNAYEKSDTASAFCLRLPGGFWRQLSAGDTSVLGKIEFRYLGQGSLQGVNSGTDGTTVAIFANPFMAFVDAATGAVRSQVTAPKRFEYIHFDAQKRLWASRADGIFCFDNGQWLFFPSPSVYPKLVGLDWQNRLLLNVENELWAIDPEKLLARPGPIFKQNTDWFCPVSGEPTGFFTDRSGIFWWGTNAGGLQKLDLRQQAFRHFFPGKSIYSQPFEDSDGSIGYHDYSDGLVFSGPQARGVLARFAQKTSTGQHFGRVCRDAAGNYWVLLLSYLRADLYRVAPDGTTKTWQTENPGRQEGNLMADEAGKIWVGSSGLLQGFDPATETWQKFDYRSAMPQLHEVFSIAQTPGGKIWLGTSQGLIKCAPSAAGDFQFSILKNEPNNPNSLRNNAVAALLPDPAAPDILWLGTKGGGLTRLDTRDGKMTHFSTRNGLPNDVIYGILAAPATSKNGENQNGILWLSSNKGLIRFDPAKWQDEIRNFTEADGVQGDEFNTWAYAKTPGGNLLFGGLNGLNAFDPADFSENPNLPPVFLTGLKINNRNIEPGDSSGFLAQSLEFLPQIELPFSKNSLTLTFAALEFTAPGKNRFRYFLENAEPAWAHETTENTAPYLNLAPGTYVFKVMAANGDGAWNPKAAELKIRILPPWWRSWWAYLLYIGVAAAAANRFYRFQLRRRLEQAENQRLKELDTFKSQLYANITHEFRTPLTVILGNADLLENEDSESPKAEILDLKKPRGTSESKISKVEAIRRNARSLLLLVNQILDLSKVENRALQLNLQRADVVAYLKYLVESFQSFANAQNQALRFSGDAQHFEMDFDPERLGQVVNNLISNALKFTPAGGAVLVRLKISGEANIEIEVEDSGIGIAPEDLPRIFERFFQAKNRTGTGGSGIGLALSKELVRLFGGEIWVESELGKGTKFTVKLPVTRAAAELKNRGIEELKNTPSIPQSPGSSGFQQTSTHQILIIEDNPDVVAYLQNILGQKFRVAVAYNGRIGLEMALSDAPDLVLSDLMMPEKNGLEVCEALKNDPRTSHVPVVLLTAKAAVEDRISGLERGADAYLAKPFHQAELLATLENLLSVRRRLQFFYSKMALENAPAASDFPNSEHLPAAEIAPEEQFLKNLRQFIEANIARPELSLEDLSRAAGMSRTSLNNKLLALTGMTPMIYLRSLRLRRAKMLLENPQGMNVSEIAFAVGFDDPKYFSRVFGEEFGGPPSAFLGR